MLNGGLQTVDSSFFKILHKIMLALVFHWLLVSVGKLAVLSILGLLFFSGLCFSVYYFYDFFQRIYTWVIFHKSILVIAVIVFQVGVLLSAHLLIRSDAAVVFKGAFHHISDISISNYLTRNPNNLMLFLYERKFYRLFGGNVGLWVLQILNILYVDISAVILYKTACKHFQKSVANRTLLFYVFVLCFSPYCISMYTDIMLLPLLSLQIGLGLDLLKAEDWQHITSVSMFLGVITALGVSLRPTVIIFLASLIFFLILVFFNDKWKKVLLICGVLAFSFGISYYCSQLIRDNQKEVKIIEGTGLAKGPLLFINLGLTYTGTDQEDMKQGLLQYIDEDKRKDYNNGMFSTESVLKEIGRRLSEYTLATFLEHLWVKETHTVLEGDLGWLYKSPKKEKTAYISPWYARTRNNSVAKFFRKYILSTDEATYVYFSIFKQIIWCFMAAGLVCALRKYDADPLLNLLSLAIFGGFFFLLLFEGGKTRYLIQFFPQIILLSSIGWEKCLSQRVEKIAE